MRAEMNAFPIHPRSYVSIHHYRDRQSCGIPFYGYSPTFCWTFLQWFSGHRRCVRSSTRQGQANVSTKEGFNPIMHGQYLKNPSPYQSCSPTLVLCFPPCPLTVPRRGGHDAPPSSSPRWLRVGFVAHHPAFRGEVAPRRRPRTSIEVITVRWVLCPVHRGSFDPDRISFRESRTAI